MQMATIGLQSGGMLQQQQMQQQMQMQLQAGGEALQDSVLGKRHTSDIGGDDSKRLSM